MDLRDLPKGLRIFEIYCGRFGLIQRDSDESILVTAVDAEDAFRDYLENYTYDVRNMQVYDSLNLIVDDGGRFGITIKDVTDDHSYIPITQNALDEITRSEREKSSEDDEEGSE